MVLNDFSFGEDGKEIISPNIVLIRSVINSYLGKLGTMNETIEDLGMEDGRKRHIIDRIYKFPDCSFLMTRQVFEKVPYLAGKGYNAIVNEKAYLVI